MSDHEWPPGVFAACQAQIPNGVCHGRATTYHHVVPKRDGGPNLRPNMRHVCRRCHWFIHDNEPWAYTVGLLDRGTGPNRRALLATLPPERQRVRAYGPIPDEWRPPPI